MVDTPKIGGRWYITQETQFLRKKAYQLEEEVQEKTAPFLCDRVTKEFEGTRKKIFFYFSNVVPI